MHKQASALAISLVSCFLAGEGAAESALTSAIPTFEELDRNHDGRLSRSEAGFNRWLSDIFAMSDADGDGFMSRVEYAEATTRTPARARATRM